MQSNKKQISSAEAKQMLVLMEQADLEAATQGELYLEWVKCGSLAEREAIYAKVRAAGDVFKLIRRLANGG